MTQFAFAPIPVRFPGWSPDFDPVFIAGIEKIRVDHDLGDGIPLTDSLRLTNNPEAMEAVIPYGAEVVIGGIEGRDMRRLGLMAFNREVRNPRFSDEIANAEVVENLMRLRLWFLTLWLVRDNAVHTEMGYVLHQTGPIVIRGTRNFFSFVFTRSDGRCQPTEFTLKDIQRSIELFRSIGFDRMPRNSSRDSGRIWRAFYFLQSARANDDLAVKIANYMTALEALFATSDRKVTANLINRTACFLADREDRHLIEKQIREAYKIRSETVHGQPTFDVRDLLRGDVRTRVEQLIRSSTACDNLVRRCFTKIIERPDLQRIFMPNAPDHGSVNKALDDLMQESESSGRSA